MKLRDIDRKRVEAGVAEILAGLGIETNTDGLRETPARVARAWEELLGGYGIDTRDLLSCDFETSYDEVIALRGVEFISTCEHHLMAFDGTASLAYIPKEGGRVVGLSKLARLVDAHARRLQIQERMTADIAKDLERSLEARAVAVIVTARHSCMCSRGIKKQGEMVTSTMLGAFRSNPEARAEVMGLFRGDTR